MICPDCKGKKVLTGYRIIMECPRCEGGHVPEIQREWIEEGKNLKFSRMQRRVGLRKEAIHRGIKFSELSNMERGRIEPMWPTVIE